MSQQEQAFLDAVGGVANARFVSLDVPNPANGPWIIVMETSLSYVKVIVIDQPPQSYVDAEQPKFPFLLSVAGSIVIDPVRATYWRRKIKTDLGRCRTSDGSGWYTLSPELINDLVLTLTSEVKEDNARTATLRGRYAPGQVVPATATFPLDDVSLLERARGWMGAGQYEAFDVYRTANKDDFWAGYTEFKPLREEKPETWKQIAHYFHKNPTYIDWRIRNADRLRATAAGTSR